jgi:galactonate dehydratase
MGPRIRQIDFWIATVTPKTRWQFVEVKDSDGRVGTGEASLLGRDEAVTAAFQRLAPDLIGRRADAETTTEGPIPLDLAAAAIWSAVDQALWDLAAQRRGLPLADLLGRKRANVNAYANINRRTVARTPAAFADSARLAVSRGFAAVKMAPFDEVNVANASLDVARAGLARIAAVRAAVPMTCAVYVDCHWRFTPAVAREMVDALADVGAAWYECPIAETEDAGPALAGLRRAATARGMILAGREEGVTRTPFQLYADAGAYDVMMPDVKYIGGIREMLETATLLDRAGIRFSPHNHTGPIGHAASLAVALAADGCDLLEMQFDETPLFEAIVTGPLPEPQGGRIADVQRPGLGCALNHDVMQQYVSVHDVIQG